MSEIIPKNASEINPSLKTHNLRSGAELKIGKAKLPEGLFEKMFDFLKTREKNDRSIKHTYGPCGKVVIFTSLTGNPMYSYTGVILTSFPFKEMPEWFKEMIDEAKRFYDDFEPNGCLITVYPFSGSYLTRHWDNRNETKQLDTIANITVGHERRLYFPEDNSFLSTTNNMIYGWSCRNGNQQPLHSVPADITPHRKDRATFSFRHFLTEELEIKSDEEVTRTLFSEDNTEKNVDGFKSPARKHARSEIPATETKSISASAKKRAQKKARKERETHKSDE